MTALTLLANMVVILIGVKLFSVVLVLAYAVYVYRTITGDSASDHQLNPLYFQRRAETPGWVAIASQLLIAIAIIVVGHTTLP